MSTMADAREAARFHNALRIMRNIGPDDLRAAGVIDENWGTREASDRPQLLEFAIRPFDEALRMPDANYERLYALIESRQPEALRVSHDAGQADSKSGGPANG